MIKKPVIYIITGPTCCGKTNVAIALAKIIGGEVISADSMQVYKYMDIGTAKVTPDEMCGIPHFLIDELYPDEEYSVAVFRQMADKYIQDILDRGGVPVVAGGSGFYINALLYGNMFAPKNKEYRDYIYALAQEKGTEHIYRMLSETDPESTAVIHPNNVKRIVRALEFFKETGQKISEHNRLESERPPKYDAKISILSLDRPELYNRINSRVDVMFEKGLVAEVEMLLSMGYHEGLVSMQGLGYRQILPFIRGLSTLADVSDELKKATRHFAKRQITWFNRQTEGRRLDALLGTERLAERIASKF